MLACAGLLLCATRLVTCPPPLLPRRQSRQAGFALEALRALAAAYNGTRAGGRRRPGVLVVGGAEGGPWPCHDRHAVLCSTRPCHVPRVQHSTRPCHDRHAVLCSTRCATTC